MLPLPYKLLAGLLAVMAIFSAGGYAVHRWDAGQYAIKEAQAQAEALRQQQAVIASYQADTLRASVAAATAQSSLDTLRAQIAQVKGQYAKLPKSAVAVDCRLSDERLRVIQSAVAATAAKNAHPSQSGNALPTPAGTH